MATSMLCQNSVSVVARGVIVPARCGERRGHFGPCLYKPLDNLEVRWVQMVHRLDSIAAAFRELVYFEPYHHTILDNPNPRARSASADQIRPVPAPKVDGDDW